MTRVPSEDIVTAGRILVAEDVLDGFGHVSLRDPEDAGRFWMTGALPPVAATAEDFIAFDLHGEPVIPTRAPQFAERVLHAAIYAARPEVNAVCHHHAAALMPFCIGAGPLYPVTQTGGFLGGTVPLWDSAAEFGATNLLVTTLDQARSVARAMGAAPVVLMRGHGVTVAAGNLRELVFKAVYSAREAEHFRRAAAFTAPMPLSEGELEMTRTLSAAAIDRGWRHWTHLHGPNRPEGAS